MQGHTYFISRLHAARRVSPVHVHVTYTMGADYGKRLRLRGENLWEEQAASHYERGDFFKTHRDFPKVTMQAPSMSASLKSSPTSSSFSSSDCSGASLVNHPRSPLVSSGPEKGQCVQLFRSPLVSSGLENGPGRPRGGPGQAR